MDITCRVCKQTSHDMIEITRKHKKYQIKISRMLESLTGLEISLDNTVIKQICSDCLSRLESAYTFQQLCIDSEKHLKESRNIKQEIELAGDRTVKENISISDKGRSSQILIEKGPIVTSNGIHNNLKSEKPASKASLCNVCGKNFKTKRTLLRHLLAHDNVKPFSCSFCNTKLCNQYSLQMHERRHTNQKPYICSYCGDKFRTSGNLLMHIRKHTGDLPYVCKIEGCDKAYPQSSELKLHIRSAHTGERSFQCDSCDKNFLTKQHLRQHYERNHEPKPSERNFGCPMCSKKFFQKRSVTKHLKNVHKVIRKDICD